MDTILESLQNIERRLSVIENKLEIFELSNSKMTDHIIFIEKTYDLVRTPLGYLKNKIEFMMGTSQQQLELPTIKNHTDTVKVDQKPIQKVSVPNVLGMQQIQAQQTLSDLNLKVRIKSKTKDKVGKVIQVSPKIGTQVASGTVVILLIG